MGRNTRDRVSGTGDVGLKLHCRHGIFNTAELVGESNRMKES